MLPRLVIDHAAVATTYRTRQIPYPSRSNVLVTRPCSLPSGQVLLNAAGTAAVSPIYMPPAMRGAVRFRRPSRRRPDADIVSLPRALSQANGAHHHNRRALLASAARIILNRDAPYPHGARTFEDVWTLIAIFVPISGALLGAGVAFYVGMSACRHVGMSACRRAVGARRLTRSALDMATGGCLHGAAIAVARVRPHSGAHHG